MGAQDENLKYVNGQWGYYKGCSCSSANFNAVDLPKNTKPILFKRFKQEIGKSGAVYNFNPTQAALDVTVEDADDFIARGLATEYKPEMNKRGKLSRVT